jgi:hypothetical protein
MNEPTRPGGSWALQGCLFGSVALFVILLIVLVVLAYGRFREHTAQPPPDAPTGFHYPTMPPPASNLNLGRPISSGLALADG